MSGRPRWFLPIALAIAVLCASACGTGGAGLARQYEYQEDVYLALDGSATLIVNASLPALVALKGLDLPVDSRTRIQRDQVRSVFASPHAEVTRVSRPWRRKGRRFIQVRLEIPDVSRLIQHPAFSDTVYALTFSEGRSILTGTVGGSPREPVPEARWDGSELVAFKLHLPSRIHFHNVRDLETNETGGVERGNILRFEQRLSDRLAGVPVEIRVEMDQESILQRTLWLFAGAFGGAMLLLVSLIWWTVRRGRSRTPSVLPSAAVGKNLPADSASPLVRGSQSSPPRPR